MSDIIRDLLNRIRNFGGRRGRRARPSIEEILANGPFGGAKAFAGSGLGSLLDLIKEIESDDCGRSDCPVHGNGRNATAKNWVAATDKIRRDGGLKIEVDTREQVQQSMADGFYRLVSAKAESEGKTFAEIARREVGKLLFEMAELQATAKATEVKAQELAEFLMEARGDYEALQREQAEEIETIKRRAGEMESAVYAMPGTLVPYSIANAAFNYIAGYRPAAPTFPVERIPHEKFKERFRDLREILEAKCVTALPIELLVEAYYGDGNMEVLVEKYFPTQQPEAAEISAVGTTDQVDREQIAQEPIVTGLTEDQPVIEDSKQAAA